MSLSVLMLVGLALADDAVTAVLPASGAPDASEIRNALLEAGYPTAQLVGGADFADEFEIVSIVAREGDDDCGGPVSLDSWRRRTEVARGRFQLLDFAAALGELVTLELEAACLDSPPSASDLFRLELSLAEAHSFLAQADTDATSRDFHEMEVASALDRAAAFGVDLAAPADADPELLALLDAARERVDAQRRPRVAVAGPGARVGARINGRPLPGGAFDAVAGANLVQAGTGANVTAAANVPLKPGSRTLIWLAPGEAPRHVGEVLQELAALSRAGADGEAPLLGAAAQLHGGDILFVGVEGEKVTLWRPIGDHLRRIEKDEPAVATRDEEGPSWRGAFGVGPLVGWSSVGGGDLEGLAGPNAGLALYGRVAVAPKWAVAVAIAPSANWRPLEAAEGEGTLFRATVPVRLGARWGPHGEGWSPEAGLDVGAHLFGTFDDERLGFVATAAAGVSRGLGRRGAFRAEAWGGVGVGYGLLGLNVGLEARR